MEERETRRYGGDESCPSNALWKRSNPGFRFLTRGDLTNRNEGTEFARNATNGSISEVTLADGT